MVAGHHVHGRLGHRRHPSAAVRYGTVGHGAPLAAVTSAAFTVVTVLLAWTFLRERIGARRWVGVGLVVAGAAVLAYYAEAPAG